MPRLSRQITLAQAENLIQAAGFASQRDLPFNRFVTILWERAGPVGRVQDAQARFLERMRKWLQYRGIKAAWIWVIENGAEMGLHSHMLVHVPQFHLREWGKMLPSWVDGDVEPATINVRKIGYSGSPPNALGPVKGLLKYILKGTAWRSASLLGIDPKQQGLIVGKRTGTSQNLGRGARQAFAQQNRDQNLAVSRVQYEKPVEQSVTSNRIARPDGPNDPLDMPDFLRRERTT